MSTDRRDFLRPSASALGGALALGPMARAGRGVAPPPAVAPPPRVRPAGSLRILILGGTGFIGPHQVRHARQRGHVLTLFNRGRTNPDLRPWSDMPCWIPPEGEYAGLARFDNDRAVAAWHARNG